MTEGLVALLGVLFFISPWVFSFQSTTGIAWTAWVVGVVTFIALKDNGQQVLRYLAAGVIESQDMTPQIGLTTVHSYTLVGGLMATS